MDTKSLVKLTSRAWSLSILAKLHAGIPGRQAPLLTATGASRSSFTLSLAHLIELGLLEKNPGHGHPLRPEFRLTQDGKHMAEVASRIVKAVPDESEFALLRRSWTVPILALTHKPQRFSVIKSDLSTITDRALSKSLYLLETHEWIRRDIDISGRSPFPTYLAINHGIEVSKAIAPAG